MNRSSKILLALSLTLAWTPACDKGKDDVKTGEGEAKAKSDPHAGMNHAEHGEPAATETESGEAVEVAADARVEINVDASGYHPATIRAPAKSKITLAFKRTTEAGCGQQLVIKALDVSKDLPLNEVVEIPIEVPESGELGFACGMDMYQGKVVPKA